MIKIQCDSCGSTELEKKGDLFVCKYCGCQYSMERIREQILNFCGTVNLRINQLNVENMYLNSNRDFEIVGGVLKKYKGASRDVVIPDGVVKIDDRVFLGSRITSVSFPDGLEIIGDSAFRNCRDLTDVSFPDSLKCIGNAAFCNCTSLTEVSVPDGASLGTYAFAGCESIRKAHLPNDIKLVSSNLFFECRTLTEVQIPDSVTSIGEDAFVWSEKLPSISIPDSVKTIGKEAFMQCAVLKKVTLGNGVTTIGDGAF